MTNNEQLNAIALMQYLDSICCDEFNTCEKCETRSISQMEENGLQVDGLHLTYKDKSYFITNETIPDKELLSTQEVEEGMVTYSMITKYIYDITK